MQINPFTRSISQIAILVLATFVCALQVAGQVQVTPTVPDNQRTDLIPLASPDNSNSKQADFTAQTNLDSTDALQKLITDLARAHIPHTFEDKKKWGMTSERWDGIKIERNGLKIETRRRKKVVNHGLWKMYSASLVDPNQQLVVRIEDIQKTRDGRITFNIDFVARINVHGRVSRWVKGVQAYSISADAIADVRLRVACQVGTSLDFTRLPPDLVIAPRVNAADLELVSFRMNRLSKIGGEAAQQLGKAVERILVEKIEEKEGKIVKKANDSIKKKEDQFRLSAADFFESKWAGLAQKLLNPETVAALNAAKKAK